MAQAKDKGKIKITMETTPCSQKNSSYGQSSLVHSCTRAWSWSINGSHWPKQNRGAAGIMQAQDTPLLNTPLIELFGEGAVPTPAFYQVLDGTFSPPANCDRHMALFLHTLQKPEDLKALPT